MPKWTVRQEGLRPGSVFLPAGLSSPCLTRKRRGLRKLDPPRNRTGDVGENKSKIL